MPCNFRAVMMSSVRPSHRPQAVARPSVGWRVSAAMLALVAGTGFAVPVAAERADRQRPIQVEADAARIDEARQRRTFTGNVVITQGTLVLRASQVDVQQEADGSQTAVATGTPQAPARFRQKREGVDEVLEGEARRIEFDGRADTLRLVDGAVLRRWRGQTLADEASGGVIVFDNAASVFSVSGGAPGSGGRVRAVITPRGAAESGAAPPPPAGR